MVNVVNGEVFPVIGASTYAFVQFGFAQQACPSGGCQSGEDPSHPFSPYVTDFWYTASDTSNGTITRAYWVDFNGDGTHDLPVLNDRYQFTITRDSSTLTWTYCVEVVSSSTYAVGSGSCKVRTRSTNGYMSRSVWGTETYNDAGAMGTTTGTDIDLGAMQYKNSSGSLFTTVTNASCIRMRVDGGTPWTSQGCAVTDYSGFSHYLAWTAPHT